MSSIKVSLSYMIKGFAIIIIVICHLGNKFTYLFTPLGGVGVALFLILSAYGLEKSYIENGGLQDFWRKRIITVFIPYGICECISCAVSGANLRGCIRYYLI